MRRQKAVKIEKIDSLVNAKLNSKSKEDIPIIIKYKKNKKDKISSMSKNIKHKLPIVNSIACNMSLNDISILKDDPNVDYISYDNKVYTQLDIRWLSR